MPAARFRAPAALAAVLLGSAATFAQAPPPAAPSPASSPAPEAPAAGADLAPEPPVDEHMVEVSLGDWGVKNEVARVLSVKIAEVPLTVVVDPALAAEVCPIGSDDLSEQAVVAATRTCAAKTFVPALADRAREQIRPPAR